MDLEKIQLLADPQTTIQMEAMVMEMHHRVGEFIEVKFTSALVFDLKLVLVAYMSTCSCFA